MKRLLLQQDFKALFDSTLDAILVADDEGVYLAANAGACDLFQASEADIVGSSILSYIPSEKRDSSRANWKKFLQVGQNFGEVELVRADGSHFIAEYKSKANFLPGQHLSVLRDVSDRKAAQMALVETNRQIVSILESVSDAVLAFDRNWKFLYANSRSEPILGRPPAEVIGLDLWKEYPDTVGTDFEEAYLRAAREEVPVHFQGYFPAGEMWLEVHVYPSEAGVSVYLRDITARKQAEDNIRFLSEAGVVLSSSLDRDHIVENLAEFAISYLADWCAIDVLENDQIQRLAVVHRDSAKIEFAHEFQKLYPSHRDDPTGVAEVLRTGVSQLWEEIPEDKLVERAPDPEWLEMMNGLGMRSIILVPLIARGQTIGVMTLVREKSGRRYDKTDLVVAQELARRAGSAVENGRLFRDKTVALRVAEEASRARDEFLAIVSHELRTPITPILGWVSLLKDPGTAGSPETLQHALEVIERNVKAQAQLVNDLLDVSRIITGKLRLEIRPMDLAGVVRFAVETVRPAAQAKEVQVRLNLCEGACSINADRERLHQVVWNLLSNAIKFTPRAGIVEVSLQHLPAHIELQVRDTGQGIGKDFLPYIFDRFRQADSSNTREHGGLGLGLSIARNLVELHGGTIEVESPGIGAGATFTVLLPIQEVTGGVVAPSSKLSEIGGTKSSPQDPEPEADLLKDLRILVVEDVIDSLETVCAILQHQGAEVRGAPSAAKGISVLQSWRPDVVLCDIGMPGEDGHSFIKRVRALEQSEGGATPAIALTAYGRKEDRLEALSSGFQSHIVKPADPFDLVTTLAAVSRGFVASP